MSKNVQSDQSPRMQHYGQLAGPLWPAAPGDPIRFTPVNLTDHFIYKLWTQIIAYGSLLLVLGLAVFLFQPAHWVALKQSSLPIAIACWVMLGFLVLLQAFLLIGTYSSTHATLKARNPVPVVPPKGLRVAFATTRAPGEPIELVRHTLEAAKRIRYEQGIVDVWLLDETEDTDLMKLCAELDVNYFTRKGVKHWNTQTKRRRTEDPHYAAKTKHGNFNAWGEHLDQRKHYYDIIAGVDTDQVPEPNYLERLLGYFNDPDVAYAVGPQVYANGNNPGLSGLVTRWAESQASFFQSTIQRGANASNSAMFVGTNYAARTTALAQIQGFYPCITEDLATGVSIHARKNPETGNSWKSVYTPDVLALGEGPAYWGPYFTQQWRWAAGAFDACKRLVWRALPRVPLKARFHYFLILTYYPMNALTWLFGVASSVLYLVTGASAIHVAWNQFIALYLMSTVLQLSLYFWNRRNNVSPFIREGSYGVSGMVISSLTAPIYLSALWGMIRGKKVNFVVTKKGESSNPDTLATFRTHLQWAAILFIGLGIGVARGNTNLAMLIWMVTQIAVCLLPPILGLTAAVRDHRAARKQTVIVGGTVNA